LPGSLLPQFAVVRALRRDAARASLAFMRLGPSRVAVVWLLALAIGQTGCAAIMQQAPKKNRAPREIPVCSTSQGGVALDGVLATLLGAGALIALANDEPAAGLALGGVGGIYVWSAVSGHQSASACEEALQDYREEIAVAGAGTGRGPATPRAPRPSAPVEASAGPPARPAGPPIEAAAPAGDEEPPPDEEPPIAAEPAPTPTEKPAAKPADEPPPRPAPFGLRRDWSDFWVEVKK